jgi:putative aldouronate transport system substrate-binding protein
MKRVYVKSVALIMMIAFILSVPVACSNKKDALPEMVDQSSELSPAVLTFYMPGDGKKDAKEVLDKVAESTNLNIKLDFKWFAYADYTEKVKTAIASNDKFDAFVCGKPDAGNLDYVDMFRNGEIKDISTLLPKYAPNIRAQLSDEEFECAKVDGKLSAVPALFPEANCLTALARKDLIDKYKIPQIKTFDDYEKYLKIVKEKESDITPGAIYYDADIFTQVYGYVMLDHNQSLVYKWDDPQMKIIPWEQTPEFKETVNLINRWYKNGYIKPLTGTTDRFTSMISNSQTFYEGTINADLFNDGDKKAYNIYMLYPDNKVQRVSPIGNIGTKGAIAFNSKSANTERALMFLNWIQSSQQNFDLFIYGFKDRHYVLTGDRISMPEGMKASDNPYEGWLSTPFLNINFERLPDDKDTYSDDFMKSHLDFINSKTFYAPHEGFFPDYKTISDDCNNRMQLYQEKIVNALRTGTYDTKETDNIIDELKTSGTDVIVQEVQKQLDKWRADNKK